MLVRFVFENFRSYRDKTTFSMSAGKISRHGGHVCECNGHRILRSAFVFGANAGGKTSFVKALDFGRRIVTEGVLPVNMDKLHFRITSSPNTVGFFQYDIFSDGQFYSYGFAIDYSRGHIVDEWLYRIGEAAETCVFHRMKDDNGRIAITTDLPLSQSDRNRFDVYADDFKDKSMRRELFLRDVGKRASTATEFGRDAAAVLRWFTRMLCIFPETRYTGVPSFMIDRKKKDATSRLMAHFDTGIDSLVEEVVDVEKFWEQVPTAFRDKLKADVVRDLTNGNGDSIVTVNDGFSTFVFAYDHGEIAVKKTKEDHGNRRDLFERSDESDGTIRLFDLIPLYENWRNGGVVVVDELDRSLHTKATLEFVKIFLDDPVARKAQLIATTHDGNLLDLDILRQDEIWFAERQPEKNTNLYSLLKFKARFDKDVFKDYMLGRYGALPVFDSLESLEVDSK